MPSGHDTAMLSHGTACGLSTTDLSAAAKFDPSDPEALLGVRVGPKWFKGVVNDYDPKSGFHHVLYDDGDKRSAALQSCLTDIEPLQVDLYGNMHLRNLRKREGVQADLDGGRS